MLEGHDTVEGVIICLLVAALLGGVSYLILHYAFKVVWANVAGAVIFLVALALCLL